MPAYDGRLRAGDLRAATAHLAADALIAVQLRHRGQPMDGGPDGPDLALVTGHWRQEASDTIPPPIGTDPVTENTVTVFILDVWLGDK